MVEKNIERRNLWDYDTINFMMVTRRKKMAENTRNLYKRDWKKGCLRQTRREGIYGAMNTINLQDSDWKEKDG